MDSRLSLRSLLAAFDVRYVIAFVVAVLLHLSLRAASERAEEARLRVARIESAADKYLLTLLDQEVGLRAYLATGQEAFLEPYFAGDANEGPALLALQTELGRLRTQVAPQLERLAGEASRWQREVADPQIALRRGGPLPNLPAAFTIGKQRFDGIRAAETALLDAVKPVVDREVAAAEGAIERDRLIAVAVLFALLVLGFVVSSFVERRTARPLAALIHAADSDQPFVGAHDAKAFRELNRLAQALERLRLRVVDREAALEARRRETEWQSDYTEAVQQANDEREITGLLERAMRRDAEVARVQVLSRNASENRLSMELPKLPAAEQQRFPIVLDSSLCRAVRTSGPVAMDVKNPAACVCDLGVPAQGSYLCAPMLSAGQVIGLVNLTAGEGHWSPSAVDAAQGYVGAAAAALGTLRLLGIARERALRDGLTHVYNRRWAEEFMPQLFRLAARNEKPLSLLMLDLDHFKRINDQYGHDVGDRVLVAFVRVLRGLVRSSDAVVRWGGEEFLVLLPETNHPGARVLAERVRSAAAQIEREEGMPYGLVVRASIGVATTPLHGADETSLVRAADAAVYRAKAGGRDQVCSAESREAVEKHLS